MGIYDVVIAAAACMQWLFCVEKLHRHFKQIKKQQQLSGTHINADGQQECCFEMIMFVLFVCSAFVRAIAALPIKMLHGFSFLYSRMCACAVHIMIHRCIHFIYMRLNIANYSGDSPLSLQRATFEIILAMHEFELRDLRKQKKFTQCNLWGPI